MKQNSTVRKTTEIPAYRLFAKSGMFQDYKACPKCGQNKIPFKKGVCLKCCNQIGDIQYVKNPRDYVKSNYGITKIEIKKNSKGMNRS